MAEKYTQLDSTLKAIAWGRAHVLNECELEMGDSPRWPFIRNRLLKIFGQKGLEGQIIEVFDGADRAKLGTVNNADMGSTEECK